MNVKELREILSQYPDDMRVCVRGYESGYNDIADIKTKEIILDCNNIWWEGNHQDADDDWYAEKKEKCEIIRALIIR